MIMNKLYMLLHNIQEFYNYNCLYFQYFPSYFIYYHWISFRKTKFRTISEKNIEEFFNHLEGGGGGRAITRIWYTIRSRVKFSSPNAFLPSSGWKHAVVGISLRYYSCLKLPEKLVIVLGRLPSIGSIELYSEAYNGRCF